VETEAQTATLARRLALALLLACLLAGVVLAPTATNAQASTVATGSGFADQWALLNTGQFSGTPGDDIDITAAWELEPGGNPAIVVGLVDSGVDFAQSSFAHANLYTQAGDAQTPASCIAALYGCSFVGDGGTPEDDDGHGTATAGEIVAGADGPYVGVAQRSTLITAKVLDGSGVGTGAAEAAGLDYVADHGARVVNVSIAGSQSAAVHEAIAEHPNTLFVAAAGNSAADDDGSSASYPCADLSPNVICVAASTPTDRLASFSNYGADTVDLAAPGTNIAALKLEGSTDTYDGTSFATPLVTGVAALAFAARPDATVAQVKQAILGSVDSRSGLAGKTVSGGRLNAYRALATLIAMLPEAPPSATVAPTLDGTATIGSTLSASSGEWSASPTAETISWERCDASGGHCQLITGADGAGYTVVAADRGHRLRAEVAATNPAGTEIEFSTVSPVVSAAVPVAGAGADAVGASTSASTSQGEASPAGVATAATSSLVQSLAETGLAVRLTAHARANGTLALGLRSTSARLLHLTIAIHGAGHGTRVLHVALGAHAHTRLLVQLSKGWRSRALRIVISDGTASMRRVVTW
jgi:hypothetical protein